MAWLVRGLPFELLQRQAQRLAHFADGAADAVGRERCGQADRLVADVLVDSQHQLLSDLEREVEIDVWNGGQLFIEEAAKEEVVRDRVDVGEADQVTDDRSDGRTTTTTGWPVVRRPFTSSATRPGCLCPPRLQQLGRLRLEHTARPLGWVGR
jgi:hypothetical protein